MSDIVFIDPLSDFGCKKLFGPGSSPESLIDFLNAILKLDKPIVRIDFITNEHPGQLKDDRKSIFDIHGRDEDGNYIIVEVQRLKKEYFKDRSVFYSMFPVRLQGEKGDWNFELKKIYTICILDFSFDDNHPQQMVHRVKLIDEDTQTVFCDRLMYWYIEIPKFNKREHELITREDKWLYVLSNLTTFTEIPVFLANDPVFKQFFMDARKAHLTELELQAYYASQKERWDKIAIEETAEKRGLSQGLSQGIFITAQKMLKEGIDIRMIHKCTGIPLADLEELARSNN